MAKQPKKLTKKEITEKTVQIRERWTKCIFENGQDLIDIKRSLPADESWMDWVEDNLPFKLTTAENFMNAAELKTRCEKEGLITNFVNLPQSSIFELARDSTPPSALLAVFALAAKGWVQHKVVLKIIKAEKHKIAEANQLIAFMKTGKAEQSCTEQPDTKQEAKQEAQAADTADEKVASEREAEETEDTKDTEDTSEDNSDAVASDDQSIEPDGQDEPVPLPTSETDEQSEPVASEQSSNEDTSPVSVRLAVPLVSDIEDFLSDLECGDDFEELSFNFEDDIDNLRSRASELDELYDQVYAEFDELSSAIEDHRARS